MSTRGTVGGAIAGGGTAGGGYVATTSYMDSQDVEEDIEVPPIITVKETPKPSGKTISEQLETEAKGVSDEIGMPISRLTTAGNAWWLKAYQRYFLEVENEDDKLGDMKGSSIRDDWTKENSQQQLITECTKLLNSEYKDSDDSNYKKAKKWCTKYKDVKSMFAGENKKLTERSNSEWGAKYDEAVKVDSDFKYGDLLKKVKEKSTPDQSTDEGKKREAMFKWCKLALDSSQDSVKEQVEKHCLLKNSEADD